MGRCRRKRKKGRNNSPLNVSQSVVELMEWFRANRNGLPKPGPPLRLAVFRDTGRGLMALTPIVPNDVLISIPIDLIVTRDAAEKSLNGIMSTDVSTHHLLAVFLIEELTKDSASFWSPYIKTLPLAFDVPFYCTSTEIDFLPLYLQRHCLEQRRLVETAYDQVKSRFLIPSRVPTFDSFTWAWFAVNTRAVYFESGDSRPGNEMALAPFLDMFNHDCQVQVRAGIFKSDAFKEGVYQIISLDRSYKKFDQVFINYGCHNNLKLCLEYGFVLDSNPHDSVPLELQDIFSIHNIRTDTDDSRILNALKMIKSHEMDKNLAVAPTTSGSPVTWNVYACLFILGNYKNQNSWSKIFSADVETLVLSKTETRNRLIEILNEKLKQVETNVTNYPEGTSDSYKVLKRLIHIHRRIIIDAIHSVVN